MYAWNDKITEYLGLEGTHKDHRTIDSKALGPHRTFKTKSYELISQSLNFDRLDALTASLWSVIQ